jgi:putative transposase
MALCLHSWGETRTLQILLTKVATPDTPLRWYRRLSAEEFDGSTRRRPLGRPRVAEGIERLVVRMAAENSA